MNETNRERGNDRRIPFHHITAETDFFFIRHGESAANAAGIVQGRLEYPLSERGARHAASAGSWLRPYRIEAVLTSPLERSRRTAEIAAETGGMPAPVSEELLIELDTGPFAGLTFKEIAQRMPEQFRRFSELSWDGVAGAESSELLVGRALRYWEKLIELAESGTRRILTVTHSGFLQWLLKVSVGVPTGWMPLFHVSNCGIFHLFVSPPHDGTDSGRLTPESYYAQWRLMNHIPYEP